MTDELEAYLMTPDALSQTESAESRLLKPGEIFGGMRAISFLGRGASSEVWRMRDLALNTDLAVKIFSVDMPSIAKKRFISEAKLLARFNHPNIVRVKRLSEDNGRVYFTMDILHPIPQNPSKKIIIKIINDVLDGLEALHAKGVLHRDIKPSNILLNDAGNAVLTDLGAAHISDGKTALEVRSPGEHNPTLAEGEMAAIGTPGYGAPEQFAGETVSPATDIHALGVLINTLFDGKIPLLWRGIVRRMTSAIPSLRYRSVDQARHEIRKIFRLKLLLTGAITSLLALLVSASVNLFHKHKENTPPSTVKIFPYADIKCEEHDDDNGVCTGVTQVITLTGGHHMLENGCWKTAPHFSWRAENGKWTNVKERGRMNIRGHGTLECPLITGTEVHLDPGITFITSGKYTSDETNAMKNSVFIVSEGANLIFQ